MTWQNETNHRPAPLWRRQQWARLFVTLCLALLSICRASPAAARDVPFGFKHTVAGSFAGAIDVSAADLDGDGDLDLIGAAYDDDDIAWWENDGTPASGTWTKTTIDGFFDGAIAVAAADVDGDGDLDLLGAAENADEVAWWENTAGDGSAWTKHTVDVSFDGANSAAAADVDGDGDLDLIGAAFNASEIAWWENTAGDGSAWTKTTVDGSFAGALSVIVADVDGDGDLDLLAAAYYGDAVAWWENDGTPAGGSWSKTTIDGTFDAASSAAVADVDGDGDLDLIGAADVAVDDVAWWENTAGDGSAWTKHTINDSFGGASRVAAADLDGDGDLDLLGAAYGVDDIAWWENETIHRSAAFPAVGQVTVAGNAGAPLRATAADVDGDGDLDLLAAAYGGDAVAWWENDGTPAGSGWTEYTVDASFDGARDVTGADIDGDGDLDLFAAAEVADDIAWWENTAGDGSTWIKTAIDETFDGASSVAAADVDGDGDLDLLAAAEVADDIAWWENTAGDGSTWTKTIIDGSFDRASSIAAADVDGDGDLDLLGAAFGAGEIAWWESDGTPADGGWAKHTIDNSFAGASRVAAADVDGDGDLDLLGAAYSANDIAWWENTASDGSAWTRRIVAGSFTQANSVAAADLDGDGDLDLLGAAFGAGEIAWWENDGTPADGGWTKHTVTTAFNGARDVAATDMDGDGDLDLLGAASLDNAITWWENRGGQFALATSDTAPASMDTGTLDDVLSIAVIHHGRSGDGDLEWATLALRFTGCDGDGCTPANLTSTQANALFDDLRVYRDTGDGVFESAVDAMVTTIDTLALTDGIQTVAFDDGAADVQVTYGTPRTYFVVLHRGSALPATVDRFAITHQTQDSSTAEDRQYDLPLTLEYAANTTSTQVTTPRPSLHFTKRVTPSIVVHNQVATYTLVLNNTGDRQDDGVSVTDILPGEMTFASWVISPTGTYQNDDQIAWNGTITAGHTLTWTWRATRTAGYGDVVNTAAFSGTLQTGQAEATLTSFAIYLPLVIRSP
jgi:uncharacterized repeat protein (TIGR01451 family)